MTATHTIKLFICSQRPHQKQAYPKSASKRRLTRGTAQKNRCPAWRKVLTFSRPGPTHNTQWSYMDLVGVLSESLRGLVRKSVAAEYSFLNSEGHTQRVNPQIKVGRDMALRHLGRGRQVWTNQTWCVIEREGEIYMRRLILPICSSFLFMLLLFLSWRESVKHNTLDFFWFSSGVGRCFGRFGYLV